MIFFKGILIVMYKLISNNIFQLNMNITFTYEKLLISFINSKSRKNIFNRHEFNMRNLIYPNELI